jgi:hypothetical protein
MIPGMLDHCQNYTELKTQYKNLLPLDDFHIFYAISRWCVYSVPLYTHQRKNVQYFCGMPSIYIYRLMKIFLHVLYHLYIGVDYIFMLVLGIASYSLTLSNPIFLPTAYSPAPICFGR